MLMSFKQFLNQQNDTIDEVEAVERYAEYKNEFRKKQVEEFFDKHKDKEWYAAQFKFHCLSSAIDLRSESTPLGILCVFLDLRNRHMYVCTYLRTYVRKCGMHV